MAVYNLTRAGLDAFLAGQGASTPTQPEAQAFLDALALGGGDDINIETGTPAVVTTTVNAPVVIATSTLGLDLTVFGTASTVITSNGNDTVKLYGAGADTLYSGAGADTIFGGAGGDSILSGSGDDTVYVAGDWHYCQWRRRQRRHR